MAPRARWPGAGGAVLSLAAAVGLAVGVRSVVALELPGLRSLLRVPALPPVTLGLDWSARAVWPEALQEAALERMAGLLLALVLAAASVALLNAVVLLVEDGAARRRELALRAAVGAGPWAVTRLLLRQVRALVLAGLALGLLLGLTAGGAARAAWPAMVDPVSWGQAALTVLPALGFLVLVAAASYVWVGISVSRRTALAPVLGSGGRLTAEPGEAFRRHLLAAFQMGMAGSVALGALALSTSVRAPGRDVAGEGGVAVLPWEARTGGVPDWRGVLGAALAQEGVVAVAVASPGALVGLGVRDNVLAQCGNCYRGGLPLPLWGARADHHAVTGDFFRALGMEATAGRLFRDDEAGRRLAVVNRTFAHSAFEKGDPVGRLVRLGRELDGWYEVVGVVEDRPGLVLGGDDVARPAVYVNALEHPLEAGELLVWGTGEGVSGIRALLADASVTTGEAHTLIEAARDAAAPLLWMARVALALGLLTLALALYGVHATALQVVRRRVQELAIRQVLGASRGRVLGHVLGATARAAAGGTAVALFFGPLLVAFLRKSASGVPAPGPEAYASLALLLVGTALAASVRAGRDALRVAPAEALE